MWGFRDLYLGDHSLRSAYLVQENDVVMDDGQAVHVPYSTQDEWSLEF